MKNNMEWEGNDSRGENTPMYGDEWSILMSKLKWDCYNSTKYLTHLEKNN